MLIANAVLPCELSAAIIVKSDFCKPPPRLSSSLNPVGVELTLCESIAEFAEDVSNLRQNGAKYADVIAVAPAPTTQAEKDIKLILDEITYTAWQLDIVESKYGKAYISEEFGKQVYLMCIGDFK